MNLKTSLILLCLFLVVGAVGYIEIRKLADRLQSRKEMINTLEQDQTSQRETKIQTALDNYATSHSLFSFSLSSAASTSDRCRILEKMQKEEEDEGHTVQASEIQTYAQTSGC